MQCPCCKDDKSPMHKGAVRGQRFEMNWFPEGKRLPSNYNRLAGDVTGGTPYSDTKGADVASSWSVSFVLRLDSIPGAGLCRNRPWYIVP